VDAEFLLAKRQYNYITGREQKRDNNILLYQIRQAFKPGEISPEEANRIGYELAIRFTKGKHAFIVTTHEDKHDIHSHIYSIPPTWTVLESLRIFSAPVGQSAG
jgi:Relaxase/Mobilisation nuclease domain.